MIMVASYCRVSTDKEDQANSFEAQQRYFKEYIARQPDWELYDVYADEGITGTSTKKRAQFNQMINDARLGKFQLIITKEVSRFSRNTTDCLEMVRKLLDLNIPIYFEKENLNTGSMESELFLAILSSMAEGESVSISENSKWSIQKRFKNGTFKISYPPYGYDWDGEQMVVNPEQAENVRWIFDQVLAGRGTHDIAKDLNAKEVCTKKGKRWTANTIRTLIVNEKYTGDVIFQKTYTDSQFNRHVNNGEKDQYALADHHEAIVSREVFAAAGEVLRQHSKEKGIIKGSGKYLNRYCFSGKIICGECGDIFKRRTHYCSEYKYIVWACNTHLDDKSKCSMKFIRDDALKAAFITMINKLIFARKLILKPYVQALRKGNNDDSLHRIQELQTLLMENSQQKERLTGFIAQGYIDQILYNEEMNTLLAQADRYNSEIEMLSKSVKGDACHIQAATALLRFTEKSSMLDSFDEELFEETVSRVRVLSREKIAFELKCGLTLTERM